MSQSQHGELVRVHIRIADVVTSWCQARRDMPFRLHDLEEHVRRVMQYNGMQYTPGSAGRILRNLRAQGTLEYHVTNRSESIYEVDRIT